MPTRDTAQLILEVDARIATAQRSVNQLANAIKADAAGMDNSLKRVEQAGERVGKSLGQISNRTRSGFTQLSFQIGDVTQGLAMGTKASTIFAQQSGQVIQALQIMGGEGNKFLTFLGGPWGLAISTATVILSTLIPKLFEGKDALGGLVDKMKEQERQAALNRQADDLWKRTIEGLTEAIRKRREEQEKARKSDVTAERESLAGASNEAAGQTRNLVGKTRELEQAVRELADARKFLKTVEGTELQAGGLAGVLKAEEKVKTIRAQVQGLVKDVEDAQKNIRGAQAKILTREAEQAVDPLKKTSDQIALEIDELTEKFTNGKIGPVAYRKEIERLTKALKDANEAGKSVSSGLSGRQVDFAQAAEIARSAGFQVNSGYRSTAQQAALYSDPSVNRPGNPVAKPGTSAHNGANGKWAIDIQITDGVTPAKIRKVFADQGVSLTKVLKEKGHFHIEGSRSEAAKAENDQQRDADKAAKAAQDRSQSFESESDQLDAAILRAKNDLVGGIEAQAKAAHDELEEAEKSYGKALDRQVADGRLDAIDAEALKIKRHQLTLEQERANEINRQVDLLKQQDERQQRTFDYQVDDLRFAEEKARTQAAHRQLQLEIIDVVYKQKEAHLRALKAELELAGKIEEAADVQAEIDRLPTDKAQDQSRARDATKGPLESYVDSLPQTAAEWNEALQTVAVNGIQSVTDGLLDIVEGTKSAGDAFRDMAQGIIRELLRIMIQKMIVQAIGMATGMADGGMVGGGINVTPGVSSAINVGGFATGGFVSGPGGPKSDSIPAMLSNGEFVMNASAVRSFGPPFFDAINTGKLKPEDMKDGGGGAGFLKYICPLAFLASESGGNPLKFLSPAALIGSKLGFADGGYVGSRQPSIPRAPRVSIPRAANNNMPVGGDTFHISVAAPNTGDPRRDRMTSLQQAADIRRAVAKVSQKGVA